MRTKRFLAIALIAVMIAALCACGERPDARVTITATFYPVYVAAANVLDGIDSVRLECLTAPTAGCLHDYQLSPGELIRLSKAGVILANGGGMENFLDKVLGKDGVTVAFAVEGVDLIEDNAHAWLDVKNYILYVQNILTAVKPLLSDADAARAEANAEAYIGRLRILDGEVRTSTEKLASKQLVTFHEAFEYFARAYGLTVAATIETGEGTDLTPEEMAALIETVRALPRRVLFTEPQYETTAAEAIARQTGAAIYVLDPIVTGELSKDVYETKMRENIRILTEALG